MFTFLFSKKTRNNNDYQTKSGFFFFFGDFIATKVLYKILNIPPQTS